MAIKTNYRKSGAAAAHKQRLRDEAAARQAKREGRSDEQQLKLIAGRPGNSARERAKLKAKKETS